MQSITLQEKPSSNRASNPLRSLAVEGNVQTKMFPIRIRNVEASDITNLKDGSPGLIPNLKATQPDLRYDPSSLPEEEILRIHWEMKHLYELMWKKQLEKGPPYDPQVLYVLEDTTHIARPIFMGYVTFSEASKTQLEFSAYLTRAYQGQKVMTHIGAYFIKEFLPTLRAHSLTSEMMKSYQTLIFSIPRDTPYLERAARAIDSFSRTTGIKMKPSRGYQWEIELSPFDVSSKSPDSYASSFGLKCIPEERESFA